MKMYSFPGVGIVKKAYVCALVLFSVPNLSCRSRNFSQPKEKQNSSINSQLLKSQTKVNEAISKSNTATISGSRAKVNYTVQKNAQGKWEARFQFLQKSSEEFVKSAEFKGFMRGMHLLFWSYASEFGSKGDTQFRVTEMKKLQTSEVGTFELNTGGLVFSASSEGMGLLAVSLILPRLLEENSSLNAPASSEDSLNGWSFSSIASENLFKASSSLKTSINFATCAQKLSENSENSERENFLSVFPVLNWTQEPLLKASAEYTLKLQQEYLSECAKSENSKAALNLEKKFARAANFSAVLYHALLIPVPQSTKETLVFESSLNTVNNIDLGLELTGRFPQKSVAELLDEPTEDSHDGWKRTIFGLTKEERTGFLEKLSKRISQKILGTAPYYVGNSVLFPDSKTGLKNQSEELGHGHGIVEAFQFKDSLQKTWRVEWDGIGRTYNAQGQIVPSSSRGGHIEIVTPKFTPTSEALNAVYNSLAELNSIPSTDFGGGHINIDLAAFEKNPQVLARFLLLFHSNRNLVSLMFQSPSRMRSAEPLWNTPETSKRGQKFVEQLTEFLKNSKSKQIDSENIQQSHDKLKKILYNSLYFGARKGRKTKYTQLVMTAYFQDVIPEKFVTADFDISNPLVSWRPTFEVEPNIRKMEFRLFDAPLSAYDASLQIKFVRAMLAASFDENKANVIERNAKFELLDYKKSVEGLQNTKQMFENLLSFLNLKSEEYSSVFWRSLSSLRFFGTAPNSQDLAMKFTRNDWIDGLWEQAITVPRSAENGLSSSRR